MTPVWQFDNPEKLSAQLNEMLTESGARFRRVPVSALRRGTFELLALVQQLVPKKTSTLVRSITAVIEKISEDVSQGRVGTYLEYARYLEEGTGVYGPMQRPITIMPKEKKALFWGAFDGNGKALIRKRAIVMGIKPLAPFGTAIGQFLPRYLEIIDEELAKGLAA